MNITFNINNIYTLIQIYISIQAQILNEQPFFNEPGYEYAYTGINGIIKSNEYNNNIRLYTMKHAMLDIIKYRHTYPQFTDVINAHCIMKKEITLQVCSG